MLNKVLSLFVFSVLFCGLSSADQLITWNLQDATFTDGGVATGFFVFDSTTQTVSSYDISVSGGDTATFPNFVYQNDTPHNTGASDAPGCLAFLTDIDTFANPDWINNRQLRLPTLPLPDSGGTVSLDLLNIYQGECYNCSPWRAFASGEVSSSDTTPVPEPGTLALLGSGFVGMLGVVRRRFRL